MKNNKLILLFFLITYIYSQQPTKMTYFVHHQVEQEEDYIQISLVVKSQSQSLTQAIESAQKITQQIQNLANTYCKQYIKKNKGDCKQAIDVGSFQIDPQYQQVRKQTVFTAFVVTYQITINVFSTQKIGQLVDRLNKLPDVTLSQFSWKPLQEVDPQESAIKQGMQQGQNLCKQVGLSLNKVLQVEEVIQEDQEDKKDQEQDEEDQQQQAQIITYKFVIECSQKSKNAKK